jgi:transcriptional regulator with XRE-family HTH domain
MTTPTDPTTLRTALGLSVFTLAGFAQHRPWCPEADGPADCTCGLYGLLDAIQCVCGHKVSVHTTRQVGDAVGWPCGGCKSDRCTGFAIARAVLATPAPAADEARCDGSHDFLPLTCSRCGVRGTLNLSIVGEDERLDITKTHPAPTPAPPTPPATEPVAALVEKPGYALFREMRERSGMTLRAAAPRLGIDFTYLSKVENGHERPSDALVRKMGRLYGFDAESWLVGRAAAEVPEPVRRVIVAAARAEVDVERLRRAVLVAGSGRFGAGWDSHAVEDLVVAIAAAYREVAG